MILAGDIGGTNTRLALFESGPGGLRLRHEKTFPSREQPSLESALDRFRELHPARISRASLGIAGPVRAGRCEATNLPWIVDAPRVARRLGLPRVGLVNDLVANAWGIDLLGSRDLAPLARGRRGAAGNRALISAGTGLGEAGLFLDGADHRPFASEGGHSDFAPRNRVEGELLEYLLARHGRVSWERVVSGPGLVNIYRFLRESGKGTEPRWLAERLAAGDPAALISQFALEGKSPLCARALDLFVSLYGARAGDLALTLMATGGVYLGGGIAPKILPRLRDPIFLESFAAKGRLRSLLLDIPVRVILNPKTALLGAARHAERGLAE